MRVMHNKVESQNRYQLCLSLNSVSLCESVDDSDLYASEVEIYM